MFSPLCLSLLLPALSFFSLPVSLSRSGKHTHEGGDTETGTERDRGTDIEKALATARETAIALKTEAENLGREVRGQPRQAVWSREELAQLLGGEMAEGAEELGGVDEDQLSVDEAAKKKREMAERTDALMKALEEQKEYIYELKRRAGVEVEKRKKQGKSEEEEKKASRERQEKEREDKEREDKEREEKERAEEKAKREKEKKEESEDRPAQ